MQGTFFVTLNESWAAVPKDNELQEVLTCWGIWDDTLAQEEL